MYQDEIFFHEIYFGLAGVYLEKYQDRFYINSLCNLSFTIPEAAWESGGGVGGTQFFQLCLTSSSNMLKQKGYRKLLSRGVAFLTRL